MTQTSPSRILLLVLALGVTGSLAATAAGEKLQPEKSISIQAQASTQTQPGKNIKVILYNEQERETGHPHRGQLARLLQSLAEIASDSENENEHLNEMREKRRALESNKRRSPLEMLDRDVQRNILRLYPELVGQQLPTKAFPSGAAAAAGSYQEEKSGGPSNVMRWG